ncbi:hypothetical protein [Methylobacterium sp. WL120]|uniref:hypothetical protein n=1 Tax=Methylobacterium sp. WL120 TaxID=2603887 RepID=UPI0011CC81AB|nr:hypothetical protein [Methylobacterium sp. WL120]TXM69622.1 hypothetical protein FV229_04575 [Methylobacterium sp. WL120]
MDNNEIRDLFKTHEVPLGRKDVWDVKGKPVILHSALERLAAKLQLTWDLPTMIRITDGEVVVLARATRKDGIAEWSFGEVKIGNGDGGGANYLIKGKQPGYPFAMAEKRAKDRVIIKLAGMHGAYSEEEAEDFAARNQGSGSSRSDDRDEPERDERQDERPKGRHLDLEPEERRQEPEPDKETSQDDEGRQEGAGEAQGDESDDVKALRESIRKCRTTKAVTELMLKPATQELLAKVPEALNKELRGAGRDRLTALGWPGKGEQKAA